MIGTARLYRCLGLLPRVWYATEIRCRYTNQTPKPAQITLSTLQRGRLPTMIRASCRSDRASWPAINGPDKERPG
jgi:hypothetical protein